MEEDVEEILFKLGETKTYIEKIMELWKDGEVDNEEWYMYLTEDVKDDLESQIKRYEKKYQKENKEG